MEEASSTVDQTQMSAILDNVSDVVFLIAVEPDGGFRFTWANKRFFVVTGLPESRVLGSRVEDVIPEPAQELVFGKYRQAAETGLPTKWEEISEYPAGRRVGEVTVVPVVDASGSCVQLVGVVHDVTERDEAARVLAATAESLKRALDGAVSAVGATAELRDPYTAGHQRRVAQLACRIADELGWDSPHVERLRAAALLHDVGKIVVPAEILNKPGPIRGIEMDLIRGHAAAGADMVSLMDADGLMADVIRQHHERLDGSGYPAGLRGEQVLPGARVLAVADVVEAMASHRPYRSALSMAEAIAEIEAGAGSRFDAEVVAACVRIVGEPDFEFV